MSQTVSLGQDSAYLKLRQTIVQNSAFLHALDEVPGTEEESRLVYTGQQDYQLTIDREKELSEDFAFLAARKDDPDNVMAVAIEEDEDKCGMTIRVATNKGDLAGVKTGLGDIAHILERAATRSESRSTLQPLLLSKIVELDLSRILSRLRSKHKPSSRKSRNTCIVHLLYNAVHNADITQAVRTRISYSKLQDQTGILRDLFDRFEMKEAEEAKGLMGQKTISEILRMVASLVEEFDLAYFFQSCRNIELDLVQSLPRSLMKVARYYKLTNELIDAARDRRYSIFKTIRVATLNAREFRTSVVRLQDCSFDEVLLRYDPNNANPVVVTKGRQKSPTLTSGKNPCKVHAEIQLLHFYEFQQVPSIPRLLSASKSACYLCYLFINAHKKFQVPRTHGRLYHGWTLPDFPECVDRTPFLEAAHRFNVSLEGQIRRTLGMKYRKFNHPAESVIVLHPTWSPCATLMISKAGTPQGSETSTIRQASPAPPEVRLQPSRSASLTRNQIPLDLVSDREIPTVAVSESPQSDEDQPVTINCGRLSSSSEVQSIMIANTTWQCLRLPSSLSNVWCRHKGLDLFLEWTEGENPADTERWMGLKYTNQLENAEIADTGNSFNLTDLRLGAVRTSQGMVGIDRTLTLIWSDTGLVVKFGHGTPPEDLDNEDQIPVHLL